MMCAVLMSRFVGLKSMLLMMGFYLEMITSNLKKRRTRRYLLFLHIKALSYCIAQRESNTI